MLLDYNLVTWYSKTDYMEIAQIGIIFRLSLKLLY